MKLINFPKPKITGFQTVIGIGIVMMLCGALSGYIYISSALERLHELEDRYAKFEEMRIRTDEINGLIDERNEKTQKIAELKDKNAEIFDSISLQIQK